MGHFLVVVVIRFALDSAVDLSTESTRISQTRCGMEVLWVPTAILRGDSWLLISPSTATGAGMDRKLGFAFRRPSSGGTEDAEPAQYLAACLGEASESTIGSVHFGSSRRREAGCAQLLCVRVYLLALAGDLILQSQTRWVLDEDLWLRQRPGNSSSTCRRGAVGAGPLLHFRGGPLLG